MSDGALWEIMVSGDVPLSVRASACDERAITVDVECGAPAVRVSGSPVDVLCVARAVWDAVVAATDEIGERCVFCERRGLNQYEFAGRYGGGFAHRGCLEDDRHARLLLDRERGE
jgi:hypothetical protein